MFSSCLATMIGHVAESVLDKLPHLLKHEGGSYEVPAILFYPKVTLTKQPGELGQTRWLTIVVARHKVWVGQDARPFKVPVLENTCNHDACWITSGIEYPLTEIYFAMAREVDAGVAPADLHEFCWLGNFEVKAITVVNVDDNEKKITAMRPLEISCK